MTPFVLLRWTKIIYSTSCSPAAFRCIWPRHTTSSYSHQRITQTYTRTRILFFTREALITITASESSCTCFHFLGTLCHLNCCHMLVRLGTTFLEALIAWSRIHESPQDVGKQKQSVYIWWAESTASIRFSKVFKKDRERPDLVAIMKAHHLLSLILFSCRLKRQFVSCKVGKIKNLQSTT